jgi:hypothetical protein
MECGKIRLCCHGDGMPFATHEGHSCGEVQESKRLDKRRK